MSSLASASQRPVMRPQERFTTASGGRAQHGTRVNHSTIAMEARTGFPICHANGPLCVPKIRFCNIGGEGHRELVVI
jgi:hypothetical protein